MDPAEKFPHEYSELDGRYRRKLTGVMYAAPNPRGKKRPGETRSHLSTTADSVTTNPAIPGNVRLYAPLRTLDGPSFVFVEKHPSLALTQPIN